jgi:hypothetical protein
VLIFCHHLMVTHLVADVFDLLASQLQVFDQSGEFRHFFSNEEWPVFSQKIEFRHYEVFLSY